MSSTTAQARHHIVPHKSGWALRRDGARRVAAVFSTKEEALEHGLGLARHHQADVLVHERDGSVERLDPARFR